MSTSIMSQDSAELWKLHYAGLPKSTITKPSRLPIKKFKYKVGNLVRVPFLWCLYQREYDERWSRGLFVVDMRFISDNIPQY